MKYRFLVLILLAACSHSAPREGASQGPTPRLCGTGPSTMITDSGVGALLVGAPVEQIKRDCNVLSDTVEVAGEGDSIRMLRVNLGSAPVDVIVDSNLVWRVELGAPGYATVDSISVGTPLGRVLMLPGTSGLEGEGALYVRAVSHCGVSFRVSYAPDDAKHLGAWTHAALMRLPSTTVVDQILIFGCGHR